MAEGSTFSRRATSLPEIDKSRVAIRSIRARARAILRPLVELTGSFSLGRAVRHPSGTNSEASVYMLCGFQRFPFGGWIVASVWEKESSLRVMGRWLCSQGMPSSPRKLLRHVTPSWRLFSPFGHRIPDRSLFPSWTQSPRPFFGHHQQGRQVLSRPQARWAC
jgi:hypothetical protein